MILEMRWAIMNKEHDTDSEGECWCEPEVIIIDGNKVYIHRDLH